MVLVSVATIHNCLSLPFEKGSKCHYCWTFDYAVVYHRKQVPVLLIGLTATLPEKVNN